MEGVLVIRSCIINDQNRRFGLFAKYHEKMSVFENIPFRVHPYAYIHKASTSLTGANACRQALGKSAVC